MSKKTVLIADFENIRYQCELTPEKVTYTISGDNIGADIYIPTRRHPDGRPRSNSLVAEFSETSPPDLKTLVVISGIIREAIPLQDRTETEIDSIRYHIETHYDDIIEIYLETEEKISFGNHMNNEVVLTNSPDLSTFTLVKTDQGWIIQISHIARERIYVNGALYNGLRPLETGDIIHCAGYFIRMSDISLTLYHQNAYKLYDLTLYSSPKPPETRYPDFQRPPRKIYPEPTEKITLPHPPSQVPKDRYGLLIRLAPMLAMILIWVVIGTMWGPEGRSKIIDNTTRETETG